MYKEREILTFLSIRSRALIMLVAGVIVIRQLPMLLEHLQLQLFPEFTTKVLVEMTPHIKAIDLIPQ